MYNTLPGVFVTLARVCVTLTQGVCVCVCVTLARGCEILARGVCVCVTPGGGVCVTLSQECL